MRSNTNPPKYRIRTNKCRDRFCEACAGEKRRLISANLTRQLPNQRLRLITFTLKSSATALGNQLDRLYESFRKLRRRKPFRNKITGGVAFFEVTINPTTHLWHPHLHVICSGTYLQQRELQRHWHDITTDSYIVDVRLILNPAHAGGYVAKYASKSLPSGVWQNSKHLDEAIFELSHRRTFQTFGTWKNLHLSKHPEDDTQWETIGPLAYFLIQAEHHDPIAIDILSQIRKAPPLEIESEAPP